MTDRSPGPGARDRLAGRRRRPAPRSPGMQLFELGLQVAHLLLQLFVLGLERFRNSQVIAATAAHQRRRRGFRQRRTDTA